MRAQSDKLELIDLHVSREASTTLRVFVEELSPPSSDATKLARLVLLFCAEMGLLNFKPHEWGTPLKGPLSVYGPVNKGNAEAALNLELRYFLDAIKRRDVSGTVAHLKSVVALWRRMEAIT